MLYYFTEAKSEKRIAINPNHVMAVFEVTDGTDLDGKTYIAMQNGGVAVNESQLDVVGTLNGVL